ncbi:MAG TPA: LptF/LptG family permease [Stellaceae bacterium]|nr:LptF/LptG family permease [Stellaceae bacterium]
MSGITRYMLRQTFIVMLFVTVAFTAAIWLLQSLRLIDLIVNRGLSIGLFFYLAVLILPRFLDVILPIAVFVAVLFIYAKLITESELIVMRSAGLSSAALARPAILVGLIGVTALYSLSLYFVPASNRAFKDLQFEIRNRFASVLLQEGIFNTVSDNLMVYVAERDANGELVGLLIHDTRVPTKPITIFAEHGAIVETAEGPRVLMLTGTRQQRDVTNGKLSVLTFDKYTLDLGGFKDAPGLRERQLDERYLHELLQPEKWESGGKPDRSAIVEANLRLAGPLAALSLAAIPLACLLLGEFNRRGQARRVLVAVLLAFLFEALDLSFKNMAARSTAAVVLLYANVTLPIGVTLWLLWRDGRRNRVTPRRRALPAPGTA